MALRLKVRLTPKGGRDAIEGWWSGDSSNPALKARVAAPPEGGKANAALIELIARTLKVRKSDVRIASGLASRTKTVEIEGEDSTLSQRLAEAIKS